MRLKRPYVASLDQVRITRQQDGVVIEYAEPGVRTTHFKLGAQVHKMTDEEILDRFNEWLNASEQLRQEYEHVAIEIPPGRPQIEYFDRSRQWTPRGGVLRCVISDGGPDNEPIIHVDNHDLSWEEFGRLLTTYAGWGMRIIFVPEDETHIEPQIEVREPREDER
jgi:hypothetical protein